MTDLLTTDEAAVYLRLSERKLYELVATGAVPCTKVTGKWLFPKGALDRWLAADKPAALRRLVSASDVRAMAKWVAARVGSRVMVSVIMVMTLFLVSQYAGKPAYAGMLYISAGNSDQPTILVTENGVNISNRPGGFGLGAAGFGAAGAGARNCVLSSPPEGVAGVGRVVARAPPAGSCGMLC